MSADFRWLLKKFISLIDISFQPPKQKISDPDELQEYKLRKRKVWFIVIVDIWKSYVCIAMKKWIWKVLLAINTTELVVEIRPKKNSGLYGI